MKKIVAATLLLLSSAGVSAQSERQPGSIVTYDTIPAPPDTLAINAARKGAYLIFDVGGGPNNISFGIPDTCGTDRKSTRLNSSHIATSRMPSSA